MFTLYNRTGQALDIVIKPRHAMDISGMGYVRAADYAQAGSQYIPIDIRFTQEKMAGKMRFAPAGAYTDYYDFLRFADATPLKLKYVNPSGVFYRDVIVTSVWRSELVTGESNTISFDLNVLGLWYRNAININTETGDIGKTYNYTYPYKYNLTPGTARLISDSYEKSPAKLTIFGPIYNPEWAHYVNGEMVATGRVRREIREGYKLVVDALTIPYKIAIYDYADNLVSDAYGSSDFATERFLYMRHGSNVVFVEDAPRIILESRLAYGAV